MIELLNMQSAWGKIKAGFKGGSLFKSVAAKGSHRFVDGIKPEVAAAQQRGISSAFTGKTWNGRR